MIHIINAGHGDCLLIDINDTLILIDAGPKKFKVRRELIASIQSIINKRDIDIAIVTHLDDDHIGGFEGLISAGVCIKQVLFNHILKIPIVSNQPQNKKISFDQDINLQLKLHHVGIKSTPFNSDSLPIKINDIIISPISPVSSALTSLGNEYIKKHQKKICDHKKTEASLHDCIDKITKNEDKFESDTSISNKSSIAVIVEYGEFRGLFLGDSHESDIINGLQKIKNQRPFTVVKLSHHGSHKNTSYKLIELIGNTEYIICADKTKNGHPNNITIARILSFNPSARFHFSSDNENIRNIINECHRLNFKVNATFPKNNVNSIL